MSLIIPLFVLWLQLLNDYSFSVFITNLRSLKKKSFDQPREGSSDVGLKNKAHKRLKKNAQSCIVLFQTDLRHKAWWAVELSSNVTFLTKEEEPGAGRLSLGCLVEETHAEASECSSKQSGDTNADSAVEISHRGLLGAQKDFSSRGKLLLSMPGTEHSPRKRFSKAAKTVTLLSLSGDPVFKTYCGTLGKAVQGNEGKPKKRFMVKLADRLCPAPWE